MNVFPDIHKTKIVLSTRWGCMNLLLTSTLFHYCHTNQFSGNEIQSNLRDPGTPIGTVLGSQNYV